MPPQYTVAQASSTSEVAQLRIFLYIIPQLCRHSAVVAQGSSNAVIADSKSSGMVNVRLRDQQNPVFEWDLSAASLRVCE